MNNKIVEKIKLEGYAYVPKLLSSEWVSEVLGNLQSSGHAQFNKNKPTGVFNRNQYFDTFALGKCKAVYDFITSKFVEDICEKYLKDYILKCHRYYETYGDHVMEWHTDSKNQSSGILKDHPGLVFIIYLNDVQYGEFQLVKGSHRLSDNTKFQENYTNNYIEDNFKDEILSLKGEAGSLVIQETRAIHRAKPMLNDNIEISGVRKSLFFQIDTYPNNTEHIFLNPKS